MIGKESDDSFKGALCCLCRKLVPAFCYCMGALPRRVTWVLSRRKQLTQHQVNPPVEVREYATLIIHPEKEPEAVICGGTKISPGYSPAFAGASVWQAALAYTSLKEMPTLHL